MAEANPRAVRSAYLAALIQGLRVTWPVLSGLLLTTEVMIAEAPKDDEHGHGGGMPPGGMGGMDM